MEKMCKIFSLILYLTFFTVFTFGDEAPWTQCSAEELQSPISSNNIQVFVSGCDNSTSDKCFLELGTNHTITIKFTPTQSSPRIERVIIAKFLKLLRGKPVEVPYGGQIDACYNTIRDSDGTNCLNNGLIQDQSYTHETSFPVFSNAPKVELLVRYIIRAESSKTSRRRPDWRKHSGPCFVCAEIPIQLI